MSTCSRSTSKGRFFIRFYLKKVIIFYNFINPYIYDYIIKYKKVITYIYFSKTLFTLMYIYKTINFLKKSSFKVYFYIIVSFIIKFCCWIIGNIILY